MAIELPHKKVLILASVCASIILISLAVRLASASQNDFVFDNSGEVQVVAGQSAESSVADKRILEALEKTQIEGLGSTTSGANPFAPNPKDSLSDRFSKDIFSAFLKFNAEGENANTDSVALEAVNNINPRDLPKDRYGLSDIRIFVPSSKDEMKKYGDTFAEIYITTLKKVTDDPERYNVLSNLSLIYKELSVKLLAVPVPDRVATTHLNLVNAFSKVSESLPIVEQQSKDPVRALLALRIVQESLINQIKLFTEIKAYFEQNGILFSDQGYGKMWNVENAPQVAPIQ